MVTNEEAAFKAAGFPFLLKVDSFASGAYINDDEVNEGVWKFFHYQFPARTGTAAAQ